jgi:branched-chain amino acid transport system substrate-binding protein
MMRGRTVRGHLRITAALLAALLVAACGTRLDDDAFNVLAFSEAGGEAAAGAEAPAGGDLLPDDPNQGADRDVDPDVDPGRDLGADQPGQPAAAEGLQLGDPGPGGGQDTPGTHGGAAPPADSPPGGGGGNEVNQPTGQGQAPNTASDVGVTPTTITVGNIASRGGPLGPHQFSPMYFGANAFFQLQNARGGINGRRVNFITCDDREENARNVRCAEQLVANDQVFAFVANSTRTYAGARYVHEQGVPDVAGYPIGNDYWRYPRFFSFTGAMYPRTGEPGFQGRLWTNSSWVRWYIDTLGVTRPAVMYYSVPESKAFGSFLAGALRAEGLEVVEYEVNLVQPNFDSFVEDMKAKGVDAVWNSLDVTGNQNFCRSVEGRGFTEQMKATVATAAAFSRSVGRDYPQDCRDRLYATGTTRAYSDTSHPEVALFHETMVRVYGQQYVDERMHQWAFEGWMAAKWFTDGVQRMGANVTREGLADWFNSLTDYRADGIFSPLTRSFQAVDYVANPVARQCVMIAKWSNQAGDWTQVAPPDTCYEGRWVPFGPA